MIPNINLETPIRKSPAQFTFTHKGFDTVYKAVHYGDKIKVSWKGIPGYVDGSIEYFTEDALQAIDQGTWILQTLETTHAAEV